MLRKAPDGFALDFEPLEEKRDLSPAEILLLKVRTALESAERSTASSLELSAAESHDLAGALERLESLQPWPTDALEMSRRVRARLVAAQ